MINRSAQNFARLFLETKKRTLEGRNCADVSISLIPDVGDSYSSETKHDRGTTLKNMKTAHNK
jgi:hypothetical protein